MIRKYTLAVVQTNSGPVKTDNLSYIGKAIDEAAKRGARLITFPEAVNGRTAASSSEKIAPEARENSETLLLFKEKAKERGIYVHTGSFPVITEDSEDGKAYNASFIIDPRGDVIGEYHKIHPFDVDLPNGDIVRESDKIKPGNELVVVDTELGRLGMAICYDLRFPELYRRLTLMGAQLLFNPANFKMITGKDQWEPLCRARAIENNCYFVAASQFGGPDAARYGNSMVVDPWGTVIARAPEHVGIIYAEIDLDYVDDCRARLGSLSNRRPDVCDNLEA